MMNIKKELFESGEKGGGGFETYLLSCRFYTVADNIMNPFMIYLFSLCRCCDFVIGLNERMITRVYCFYGFGVLDDSELISDISVPLGRYMTSVRNSHH